MWAGMTAVMMAPVVWPWLRALARSRSPGSNSLTLPAFTLGYGVAWIGFSAVMALAQLLLQGLGTPSPLISNAPALAGGALLVAGAFQFSKLKDACLSHCRSPFGYFATYWRPGVGGAFSMGARHGVFCLGCCWAIMALALAVGMLDARMMGVLMAAMVLETVGPFGRRPSRPIGVALLLWGVVLLLA
ncbi:MAG: DUF2182 domain-containing protein [Gemmatimonadota bacterium]